MLKHGAMCSILALSLLLCVCVRPAQAQPTGTEKVKVSGYAEWHLGEVLIVEGQRVRVHPTTRFDGDGVGSPQSIPLGFEVEAEGVRLSDGSLLATDLSAKENGSALFEVEVRGQANDDERRWRRVGRTNIAAADGVSLGGAVIERGPEVERVRRIMTRLTPAYLAPGTVRVYVVESNVWNAFAMPNGSIWVHTELLDTVNNDELAVVLGHELAHFTHEHSRRRARQVLWAQLVAAGADVAIGSMDNAAAAVWTQYGAQVALTAWVRGYGRDNEDQADRVGLRYAHEAGYDVSAGPVLWRSVRDRHGERDPVTNFLVGTHSRPSDRVRNLNHEIALNYSRRPALPAAAPPNPTVRVSAANTPIRQDPYPDSPILVTAGQGVGVEVMEARGDWYRVRLNTANQTDVGYVRRQLLDEATTSTPSQPRRVDTFDQVPESEIAQVAAQQRLRRPRGYPRIETSLGWPIWTEVDSARAFDFSIAQNANSWLGTVVNVSTLFASDVVFVDPFRRVAFQRNAGVYMFTAGPRFSFRSDASVIPYGQFLAGMTYVRLSGAGDVQSGSAFTLMPGGGADIFFTDQFGIRFGADFPVLFEAGESPSTFRFTIGVTFRSRPRG